MLETTSAVTAARYEQGLTYAEFLAQATVNLDRFELYYGTARLSPDDTSFFKKAVALPEGPAKMLVLAEDWCGDVYRDLPLFVRIAEATGMTLRIFPRDKNPDIMDEFLSNEGRSRAIPVVVFYTNELRYVTHFTERPALAHAELATAMEQVKAELPNADRETFIREILARILPRFPVWQAETLKEIRQLLSTALNIA